MSLGIICSAQLCYIGIVIKVASVSYVTGVVKRIIPAVASTNAVIAGMKVKLFKLVAVKVL